MSDADPFILEWKQTEVDLELTFDKIKALQWAETKTQPMDPDEIKKLREECVRIYGRRTAINMKRLKIWREREAGKNFAD